jgi:hypothetical protein
LYVLLFVLLAGGCGGSGSTVTPDGAPPPTPDARVAAPALVSVELAPAPALARGESHTLTVTGIFDDGAHSVVASGLAWESSAPAVATISEAGVVTAVGAGAATIRVTTAGLRAQTDVAVIVRVFGDDYGPSLGYAPFGGSTNAPVLDTTDKHTGTASLRIEVPAAGYTGGAFKAAAPIDVAGFTAVTFWARASKPATLNVVGFGNDASGNTLACEWNAVPLTTIWTRYVVPIPGADKLGATQGLFHVAEGSDEGAYTLWLDDIQYEVPAAGVIGPASPAIATETVQKAVGETAVVNGAAVTYAVGGASGSTTASIATARRYFTFQSSNAAVATVDGDGVVTAHADGAATITAKLGALDAIGALTFQVGP